MTTGGSSARWLVACAILGLLFIACARDRFEEVEESASGEYVPSAESGPEACGDGIDNDEDGFIDCVDLDCQPSDEPAPPCVPDGMPEDTDDRCQDGIDNDENGFTDCEDFDCSMNQNITVCNAEPEDNDEACSDGVDNNGNGFVDCADFDCQVEQVTVCPLPEVDEETCADQMDNDGDGKVDCADEGCADFCN